MGTNYNPKIVTNGLVLCLDAANRKSYPGSGTTWTDLSGNGNNGTLTNGPTFSNGNGGSLVFDGVNDYVELNSKTSALEFQPSQAFTQSVFVKTSSTYTGTGSIISNMDSSSGTFSGYDIWFNGNNQLAMHFISIWSGNAIKVKVDYTISNINNWTHILVTYDGSTPTTLNNMLNSVNFYINGVLYNNNKAEGSTGVNGFDNSNTTISYGASQKFRVASRWNASGWNGGPPITVGSTQVYNRVLSAAEIQQNFNATRGRYGI